MSNIKRRTLQEYYASLGMPEDAWHVGPEHPSLEELAISLLSTTQQARVLEVGVQSGGFAVPVVLATAGRPGFAYTGVDSLDYTNAVPLRLVGDYLRERGVAHNLRFIEADSTKALRSLPSRSFDLILLDHYKPKYSLDLFEVCCRDLLSGDGVIVLHDVLAHAAQPWRVCERVCRAFGYAWTIDSVVFQGAALVRRGGARRQLAIGLVRAEVLFRWWLHALLTGSRRRVGRILRALGLR